MCYINDEFILGVELGEISSVVAFYDTKTRKTELIDISGGFGKISVPTAALYFRETDEWVFGEGALNCTFGEAYLGEQLLNDSDVLNRYVRYLADHLKNIEPLNETSEGAVAAIRSECVFNYHYSHKLILKENVLLIDFDDNECRIGVYEILPNFGGIEAKCIIELHNKELSVKTITNKINKLFVRYYCEHTGEKADCLPLDILEQLWEFSQHNKSEFFIENERGDAINLYYNFTCPAFKRTVTPKEIEMFYNPTKHDIEQILFEIMEIYAVKKLNTVLCVGSGFEITWLRRFIQERFVDSNVVFYQNPKGVVAEGACLIAAQKKGVACFTGIKIIDACELCFDIGFITIKNGFDVLFERGTLWWQALSRSVIIINEDVGVEPCIIEIIALKQSGRYEVIGELILCSLPSRPAGTTRLGIEIWFTHHDSLIVKVEDLGFGIFFPSSGYKEKFEINVG